MIRIVDTGKYYSCLSCGRDIPELLRTFNIGRNDNIKQSITLCTECLGELVKQEILYQPKEWHNLEENPTDLPKENMKQVIVQDLDGDCYMGWYCIHQNCWYDNECPDTIDYPIKVIKWKEIEK